MSVRVEKNGPVTTVILDRPEVRNAVNRETAEALSTAFRQFEGDPEARVGVLYGEGGTFSAGADLKAIALGQPNRLEPDGDGPLGVSRMFLEKPVIAAIEGHAVAGGLELALWCDLRVAEEGATLGVYCRRFGVPLIDGGTVRLPRLIGLSRALDLILTGRGVSSEEALQMGLINRVVPPGQTRQMAEQLAHALAAFPQWCLRTDRRSAYEQWDMGMEEALRHEFRLGRMALERETHSGAQRFAAGKGRHGRFEL